MIGRVSYGLQRDPVSTYAAGDVSAMLHIQKLLEERQSVLRIAREEGARPDAIECAYSVPTNQIEEIQILKHC